MSKKTYEVVLNEAKKQYPLEACGLLAGRIEDSCYAIEEAYPLVNIDESSQHFSMDPKDQFKVIKKVREEGMKLLGNFHSHPETPSRPSEEDKRLAYDSSLIYGILSLMEDIPVLRFFHIEKQSEVTLLTLTIE